MEIPNMYIYVELADSFLELPSCIDIEQIKTIKHYSTEL